MDFIYRIGKEIRITAEAFRESVIAVAERVNRKVQVLTLHWQASTAHEQIDMAHHDLGNRLCDVLVGSSELSIQGDVVAGTNAEMILLESIGKIRLLKQEVQSIETLVREFEADTLREDLISLQHDLSLRSASIRRITVESDALANGRAVVQLGLPPTVRLAAILRGPTLISSEHVELRPGDIVVLVGLQAELQQSLPFFSHSARV